MNAKGGMALLPVILIPPVAALIAAIFVGWFVVFPHVTDESIRAEEESFQRIGAIRAREISQLSMSPTDLNIDYLDRIAFRNGVDQVFLLDAANRALFANDAYLQSRHVAELAAVPPQIRQAIAAGACGSGLIVNDRLRNSVGCWPVSFDRISGTLTARTSGHLVMVLRIDDNIAGVRADLLNHGLQLAGVGAVIVGFLLFVLLRFILRPVVALAEGLASIERGEPFSAPAGGLREIAAFGRALQRTVVRLQSRERQVEAILDTAIDAIVTIDREGRILQANASTERLFGHRPADLIGRDVGILMHPDDAARHRRHTDNFANTEKRTTNAGGREVVARRSDGSTFLANINVAKLDLGGLACFTASIRDVTADRMAEFELHKLANFDQEVGMPNRNAWTAEIGALVGAGSDGVGFSVLVAVVRNLDDLIVTFGPAIEAATLGAIAAQVGATIPSREIAARISRSRLGFVIPAGEIDPILAAVRPLEATFKDGVQVGEIRVFADIRIVVVPQAQNFGTGDLLLQEIEAANSWALAFGDRRAASVLVYDESISAIIRARARAAAELPAAIGAREIYPVFQPKTDLRSGVVCGVETLARWRRADGVLVSPAVFIPVAEKMGLIDALDAYLAEETFRALMSGDLGLPVAASLSINASAREFDDAGWIDRMLERAARFGVPPEAIEIEVTESAVLDDIDKAAAVLGRLRAKGFRVAIDDMGTGYASLTYLKRLPADVVKIDQSFVRDLTQSDKSRLIVRSMISLAHELGMVVVAEGVEDAPTAEALTSLGCDIGQGWHFGRPMTAAALKAALARAGESPSAEAV